MAVTGRVNPRRSVRNARHADDRGSIMVMTLVLTIVMASVVLAITSYAAVGLRSSKVTDSRMERVAAAEAGVWWAAEQLVAGTQCGDIDVDSVPGGLELNGQQVTVSCSFLDPHYRLVGSVLIFEGISSVEATVQVVPGTGSYQVLNFRVRG